MALHSSRSRLGDFARSALLALGLALSVGTIAAPSEVAAQEGAPGSLKDSSPQDRPQMISFFTGFQFNRYISYGFPLTLGGRYYFPIVPNGFIPSLNDEFGIEGGIDFLLLFGDRTFFGFGIPVDAMWSFHFTPNFDAYAKIGFIFGNVFGRDYYYSNTGFWFDFRPAVGLRLKINDALFFRAEVGYPSIMAGLGFAF
ncbi:MAG: hypothetical protein RL701_4380 [Pseudomonadota bacterium]